MLGGRVVPSITYVRQNGGFRNSETNKEAGRRACVGREVWEEEKKKSFQRK